MLIIKVNIMQYDYDIRAIVKSFFLEEQVKIVDELKEAQTLPAINIDFLEEQFVIFFQIGKQQQYNEKVAFEIETIDYKNQFKKFLYESLCQYTNSTQPWGNLTGIRPTKIPMGMLEQGKSKEEIKEWLIKTHSLSPEKADLSIFIAQKEIQVLSNLNYTNGYSLYVGIPFCPTTCLYCSFTSYPLSLWEKRMDEYLEALEKEIDYLAQAYKHKELNTVYVGGGTPTTLSPAHLERLMKKITTSFSFEKVLEFTVEAGRADSITREKLAVLKKYQVTRISINPQTMKEETLKKIGRHHTVSQVKNTFLLAREMGFDNINMDIILGLPGETCADVADTMNQLMELNPDNITVHSLAIKRASKLSQWIEENGYSQLKNSDETMEIAANGAKSLKMHPYYLYRQKNISGNFENVGYSKEGKEGIYNILIMEEKQTIVAVGAGSITKLVRLDGRIERTDAVKDVALYIERIDEMIERKKALFL